MLNLVYAWLSLVIGLSSFVFANPAALPVFGLALGCAGLVRESRGLKRRSVYLVGGLGSTLSALGSAVSLLS